MTIFVLFMFVGTTSSSFMQQNTVLQPDVVPTEQADDTPPSDSDSSENSESAYETDNRLKSLHDQEEIEMNFRLSSGKPDFELIERKAADEYIKKLTRFLPKILQCYSHTEADEMIQNFSSEICNGWCFKYRIAH